MPARRITVPGLGGLVALALVFTACSSSSTPAATSSTTAKAAATKATTTRYTRPACRETRPAAPAVVPVAGTDHDFTMTTFDGSQIRLH